MEHLPSPTLHDGRAFIASRSNISNNINDSTSESNQDEPLTSINHKSDSNVQAIEGLPAQRTVESSPSVTSLSIPSARARALAEHEDSSQIPKPLSLSFTPAPLQTNKQESSSSQNFIEDQNGINSATLSPLSFTPLPLSSTKRESKKSLFPTPKNQIEFDRSKHDFQNIVEEELPSPLKLKISSASDEIDIIDQGGLMNQSPPIDFDHILDGLEFDDQILDELEITVGAVNSEKPDQGNDTNLYSELDTSLAENLSLLAEDADALNQDFEEAFVAIQTPIFNLNPLNDRKSEAKPVEQTQTISSTLDSTQASIMKLVDQPHILHWQMIQTLDMEDNAGVELLDLIELFIQSEQYETAYDQLAIALLAPKPALSLRYVNAFLLGQLRRYNEATQSLKDIYLSLDQEALSQQPSCFGEILIKWALYSQYAEDELLDFPYILEEAQKISAQFSESLTQLIKLRAGE